MGGGDKVHEKEKKIQTRSGSEYIPGKEKNQHLSPLQTESMARSLPTAHQDG